MPISFAIHDAIWRELPSDEHDRARRAMEAIVAFDDVEHSPQVARLSGSAHQNAYRLKVGRYRILFTLGQDGTIAFQTAFLKRRGSDYDAAVARHDARARASE